MKKETDEIPIDIILYNAIKFCPSPINSSLNLSFGAQLISNIKKEISANDILNQLNSKNHSEKINGIPSIFFNLIQLLSTNFFISHKISVGLYLKFNFSGIYSLTNILAKTIVSLNS